MKKIIACGVAALVLVSTAACGANSKATEQFKDAGVSNRNDDSATIFTMPDGFGNGASKCLVPGIRVTVLFHGNSAYGGVAMVADKNCR